jgi:hypothetical protein
MLKDKTIICFGSSTWTYPGLQQTIMRKLSNHNKIIFVNSIGTRKIQFKIDQLPFYCKRIFSLFVKDKAANTNVFVCDPWVIPVAYSRFVNILNKLLLSIQLKRLISKNNISQYILWVGTPVIEPFWDIFNAEMTIYNPVDRFFAFEFVDGKKIKSWEESIASKCDLIIGTSDAIREDLLPFNRNTFSVSHGVDIGHFRQDVSAMVIPEDIAHIQKPIIGFFGGLSERLDYELILATANKYKDFSMVLIGSKLINLDILNGAENIHLIGAKDFSELPLYLNQFDVCLIPYKVNELTRAVDPIKLREYLSIGKPVVSVDLPEVRKLQDVVYIGKDIREFVRKVGQAIDEDSPKKQDERIRAAELSDWKYKMREIEAIILPFLNKGRTSGSDVLHEDVLSEASSTI